MSQSRDDREKSFSAGIAGSRRKSPEVMGPNFMKTSENINFVINQLISTFFNRIAGSRRKSPEIAGSPQEDLPPASSAPRLLGLGPYG